MDLSWLSLAALAVVVVASCTLRANPGVLAIVLAWLIAVYAAPLAGATLGLEALAAGFPARLFLTLVGVSLFFSAAEANGTLAQVARQAERMCRGNLGLIAILFFAISFGLGSVGPGNIAAAGIVAPVAMATAARTGIPPLLMALLVGHGAIASTLSPLSAAGVVADKILANLGLAGNEWRMFAYNALANAAAALVGFVVFGGIKLLRVWHEAPRGDSTSSDASLEPVKAARLSRQHAITLTTIAAVVLAVVGGGADVGMAAFAGALALFLLGAADERESFVRVPWSVIVMVVGVSVLTSLLEKTAGTRRFAELVDAVSTPGSVTGVLALVTGVVSIYSSTTGVVLPAFLPMVAELVEVQPQSDPLALASAVILGGNLVDVSPLSTIGALCVAAAPAGVDRRRLFNQLLAWGFAMAAAGALGCQLFFRAG